MAEGQVWEVIGGGENGGIVVRAGQPINSQAETERLSTGSLVRQLKLVGDRLQYQRLTGGGPDTGWVSTNLKGKALLERSYKDPSASVSSTQDSADPKPADPFSPPPKEASPPKEAPWGSNTLFEDIDDLDADKEDDEEVEIEDIAAGATTEDLVKVLNEERKARAEEQKARAKLEKQMRKLMSGMKNALSGNGCMWKLGDRLPQIHPSAWIAPGAVIIGTVNIKQDASVWFNCTLRGDNEQITIGEGSDIQDNSILHCDPGKPLTVGNNVLVGHQVCLHGCTIGNNCLIGMRSVILDEAKVGNNCFIAAGSQIPEKKVIPDGSMVQGAPCKVLPLDQVMPNGAGMAIVKNAASGYVKNKNRFKAELEPSSNSAFCMVCT